MMQSFAGAKASIVVVAGILLLSATTLPASATTCPSITRALARGSTGADVMALQQFLITQGLLSADSATGYFGSLTEKGVQTLQKTKNIVTSGTTATTGLGSVGKKTQVAIAALCTGSGSPPATQTHVVPELRNTKCPQIELPIGKACVGTWREVRDAIKDCTASWKCERQ